MPVAARTCSYQMVWAMVNRCYFTERSFEMIAAMLATVKVGASYIPIDIDFPNKRQGAILEDAKVTAVMSYGVEIETTYRVIQLENAKGFVESKENRR
ncbi:AMP-binding protein [Staphylococcus aureus]